MHEETEVPPQDRLMQSLFAFMITKAVSAAASLKVADALKGGPKYYTDLAAAVGAQPKALHRMMRTLACAGIFSEPSPGKYEINPVSDFLRSDHPASKRDQATMNTTASHRLPWGFPRPSAPASPVLNTPLEPMSSAGSSGRRTAGNGRSSTRR
jgi:hypothetical protein